MPRLARWYIRTAMVFFAAGILIGLAMITDKWLNRLPAVWLLQPEHVHFLLVGWMVQFIIGVAYWMFPRLTSERPRGSETLGWITYWTLNAGLVLRGVSEPLYASAHETVWGALMAVSGGLQVAAILIFLANTWGRVRALPHTP